MDVAGQNLLRFFWYFIRPQKVKFLYLILGMLGWALQESLYPYFIKQILDKITHFRQDKIYIFLELSTTLTAWLGVWIAIGILFRIWDFWSAKVFPRFQVTIRQAMIEYTLLHSHQFFSDEFSGTISSKIFRISDAMLNVVTIVLGIFYPVILAFCINIIILFQAKPMFSYIMAGWFGLHMLITYIFTRQCLKKSLVHSGAFSDLSGNMMDVIYNVANVRFFARRKYEMAYIAQFQNVERQKHYELLHHNAIMKMFLGATSQLCVFVMVGFGVYAWQRGWISIGELVLVLSSLNLMSLAWYMGQHLIKFYENVGICKDALSLVQKPHQISDFPHAIPLKITQGEIIFDSVSFHYGACQKLFRDKTVVLESGKKVGLVGFSGSGKTTFVNLILRLFEVESGRILIDKQDIKMVTQDSLRRQIALIPQDTSLFHRTVMENIRYGRLEATNEEVIAASKKAHCDEFIQNMQFGYDTLVGEHGVKLSGGQRQRIAIARAILKDAPILILDEATSSLDSLTEKHIQEGFIYLMHRRTTIVIAHRLSTLAGMDRILVFKSGQIVEDGTHLSLLETNSYYAQLWRMQADGFLRDLA